MKSELTKYLTQRQQSVDALDILYPFVDALQQHDLPRLRRLILQTPRWETEYKPLIRGFFKFFMKDGWEGYKELEVRFYQYHHELFQFFCDFGEVLGIPTDSAYYIEDPGEFVAPFCACYHYMVFHRTDPRSFLLASQFWDQGFDGAEEEYYVEVNLRFHQKYENEIFHMLEKWKSVRGYEGHWMEENVEQLELTLTDEKYPFVVEQIYEEVADQYWSYHLRSLHR